MKKVFKITMILTSIVLSIYSVSCKKAANPKGNLTIEFQTGIDSMNFIADSIQYAHPAEYLFGISRLKYYISHVQFHSSSGITFQSEKIVYVQVGSSVFNHFNFSDLPEGNYESVSFLIGLDSAHNQTDALPATAENINMAWPDAMGGGYHFLKLEGYYRDSTGTHGYAMHLGNTKTVVHAVVQLNNYEFKIGKPLVLKMNVSEWFKNPALYDFNTDGNYSMGNMSAMMKLSSNGKDVFTMVP